MTKTRWMALLLGALAGCAAQQQPNLAPPSSATPGCTRDVGQGRWSCKVEMDVNERGQLVLTLDPIVVPGPGPQQKVVILWTLRGNEFHFGSGDGVFVQADGQLEDACAADAAGDCTAVARPKKFRVRLKNDAPFSLPYCVRFRSDARTFEFDPTIANSFGFIGKESVLINPSPCRP